MKKRILSIALGMLALIALVAFSACSNEDTTACAHSQKEWVEPVAATCTKDGTVGHYVCPDCNLTFDANGNLISELTVKGSHTPASEWSFADGKHYHACANCNAHLDEANCSGGTATCTQRAVCQVCSNEYGETAAHSYTVNKYNEDHHWAECACGAKDQLLCHVHSFSKTVTPDCTEGGYDLYACACGHTYVDGETQPTNHIFATEWSTNSAYHWHASICGCESERSDYEQHEFVATVTNATCLAQGYTTYTCADCGYFYVSDYVNATGHSVAQWNEVSSQLFDAKNCDYTVVYEGFCSACQTTVTKSEQMVRHSLYARVTSLATCQSEGVKSFFCSSTECKHNTLVHHTEAYTDENAHVWVEDSSALLNGLKSYHCSMEGCTATKKGTTGNSATLGQGVMGNTSEIEFSDAIIGLDQAIKDKWNGQSVQISAGSLNDDEKQTAINQSNLNTEQIEQLAGCQIYSFTMVADQSISQLGGVATIRLPYTLGEGEDPNSVIVWYISDGVLSPIEADYSEDASGAGFVTFKTDHFSYYTVDKVDPAKICELLNKHDENRLLVVEPTCTTGGYTICLSCGHQVEGSYVEPTGHNIGMTVIATATCDTNGRIAHACTDCGLSYEVATPAIGHYHVLKEQTTATCGAAGSVTYVCAHCNDSYTITTPKLSHSYHITVIEPTCDASGYTEKTCTRCGEVSRSAYVEAKGHVEGTEWYANEKEHYHVCITCGEIMSAAAHVPGAAATEQTAQICTVCEYTLETPLKHTHTLTKVEGIAPTCTVGGIMEHYTCACGAWFMDEAGNQLIPDHTSVILDAKGHTAVATDYVEPTCTTVGYTAGLYCSECKTYLRGHVEISAYGHDYAKLEIPATCTKEGIITYRCNHCGDTAGKPAETIPVRAHQLTSTTVAPTCTEGGYTLAECAYCDYNEKTALTEALGHSYATAYLSDTNGHWHACIRCDAKTTVEAHTPDYAEATETHGITCVYCNYVIAEILSHEHKAAEAVKGIEPTCTTMGHAAYYVCACGEWFSDEACTKTIFDHSSVMIPALGHKSMIDLGKEATCTEEGYTAGEFCKQCETWLSGHKLLPVVDHDYEEAYEFNDEGHYHTCKSCGAPSETEVHVYQSNVVEPTCEENGYTTYTCACGHRYTGDETEAIGHSFGDWSMNHDGTHSRRCANDGSHVETGDCQYETTVHAPTCEKGGYTDYICTICKHHEMRDQTEAHGHSLTDWESDGDGNHTRRCKYEMDGTCAYTETVACSYGEHLTEPTCTENGSIEKICEHCHHRFVAEEIPATGHQFERGECVNCGELSNVIYTFTLEEQRENGMTAIEKLFFNRDGIAVDESYYRYPDGSEELVYTSSAYWREIDGRIRVYQDEAHTQWILTMLILEDGSLEWLICEEHSFEELLHSDATCTEEGYTLLQCKECGTRETTTTPALGHNMVSGTCDRCGETSQFAYLFEMDQITGDGSVFKVRYFFHHNGIVDALVYLIENGAETQVSEQSAFWAEADGFVNLYLDAEHTEFAGRLTILEDGSLEIYVCEKHEYVVIGHAEPTCTENGFHSEQCVNCGETIGIAYPPLGHDIVDGFCRRCGVSVEPGEPEVPDYEDLEDYRSMIIGMMDSDFIRACASQDVYSKYEWILRRRQEMVERAGSAEEIDRIYEAYSTWLDDFVYPSDGMNEGDPIDEGLRSHQLKHFEARFSELLNAGYMIDGIDKDEYEILTEALHNAYGMDELYKLLNAVDRFLADIENRKPGEEDEIDPNVHRENILSQMYQLWERVTEASVRKQYAAYYDQWYHDVKQLTTVEELDRAFNEFVNWIQPLIDGSWGDDGELESIRKEFLSRMDSLYKEACASPEIHQKYYSTFRRYLTLVTDAGSADEIKMLYSEFKTWVENTVRPDVGSDEQDPLDEEFLIEVLNQIDARMGELMKSYPLTDEERSTLRKFYSDIKYATSNNEIDTLYSEFTVYTKQLEETYINGDIINELDRSKLMETIYLYWNHLELNGYEITQKETEEYQYLCDKMLAATTRSELAEYEARFFDLYDRILNSDTPVEPPVDELEAYRGEILTKMEELWMLVTDPDLKKANAAIYESRCRSITSKYTSVEEINQAFENFQRWLDKILAQQEADGADLSAFRTETLNYMDMTWSELGATVGIPEAVANEFSRLHGNVKAASSIKEIQDLRAQFDVIADQLRNGVTPDIPPVDELEAYRGEILTKMEELWMLVTDLDLKKANAANYESRRRSITSKYTSVEEISQAFENFQRWLDKILAQQADGADLSAFRAETLNHMDLIWSELSATVGVPEAVDNEFSSLYGNVKTANSIEEIKSLRDQFDVIADQLIYGPTPDIPPVDEELENRRIAVLTEMEHLWEQLSEFDRVLAVKYQAHYQVKYLDAVKEVTTIDQIDGLYQDFIIWLEEIQGNGDGEENIENYRKKVLDEMSDLWKTRVDEVLAQKYYEEFNVKYFQAVFFAQSVAEIDEFWNNFNRWLDRIAPETDIPDHEILEWTRQEVLEEMQVEWDKLLMEAGYFIPTYYDDMYQSLRSRVEKASSTNEIYTIRDDEFRPLLEQAKKEIGPYVCGVGLEKYSYQLFDGNGMYMNEFIEKHVIGSYILLDMSDGSTRRVPITWEMIRYEDAYLNEIGSYAFRINYRASNYDAELWVSVEVTKDMSSAQFLGEYLLSLENMGGDETFILQLYDNGYAILTNTDYDSQEVIPYAQDGSFVYIETGDGLYVFILSEKGFATIYDPAEYGENVIAEYTAEGMTLTVYGNYTGAGMYLVKLIEESDGESVWLTILLAYNHEERSMNSSLFGDETVYFDENGKLIIPEQPDDDMDIAQLEQFRSEVLWEMQMRFDALNHQTVNHYAEISAIYNNWYNLVAGLWNVEEIKHEFDLYNMWMDRVYATNGDDYAQETPPEVDPPMEDEDLETYRHYALIEMTDLWKTRVDEATAQKHYEEFDVKYLQAVFNAQSIAEIDEFRNNFNDWIDKIAPETNTPDSEDLERIRKEVLEEMDSEWGNMRWESGSQVLPHYEEMYQTLRDRVYTASSADEIYAIRDYEFWPLLEEARNNRMSNILHSELEQYRFELVEGNGMYMKNFIEQNVIGLRIFLTMRGGLIKEVPITWEMIQFEDVYMNEIGQYELQIIFEWDNYISNYWITVEVIMDMSQAQFLGEYKLSLENMGEEENCAIQLYDNGYAVLIFLDFDEREIMQYEKNGSLVYLETGDGKYVFMLSEKGVATIYDPAEYGENVIAEYTVKNMKLTVYGDYSGAGMYFVKLTEEDDGESVWLTIVLEYNHEERSMTSSFFGDKTVYFDESGKLISPDGPNHGDGEFSEGDVGTDVGSNVNPDDQPNYAEGEIIKPGDSMGGNNGYYEGETAVRPGEFGDVVVIGPSNGNGDYVFNYGTITDVNGNPIYSFETTTDDYTYQGTVNGNVAYYDTTANAYNYYTVNP